MTDKLNEGYRAALERYVNKLNQETIQFIANEIDPSPTKKYTEWFCGIIWHTFPDWMHVFKYAKWDMVSTYRPVFEEFNEMCKKKYISGRAADIYSYKNIKDLREAVDAAYDRYMQKKKIPVKKFQYNDLWILQIETKEQAIKYGRKTNWCISAVVYPNKFHEYNEKYHVFIVLYRTLKYCVLIGREKAKHMIFVYNEKDISVPSEEVFNHVPKEIFFNIINHGNMNESLNKALARYAYKLEPKYIRMVASNIDPSPTKKYTEWIVDKIVKYFKPLLAPTKLQSEYEKWLSLENYFKNIIVPFDELVKNHVISGREADIYSYNKIDQFSNFVKKKHYEYINKKKVPVKKFKHENWWILKIENQEQAIRYGKGTRWCLSSIHHRNAFNEYNENWYIFYLYCGLDKFTYLMNREDRNEIEIYDNEDNEVEPGSGEWMDITDQIPRKIFLDIIRNNR